MAGNKFCGASSILLMLSVPAFIMLSGAVVTEKTRRCYWCGPLAEQVHRSQRAPPCDSVDNQITACEPELPYCAVIATSPPYVESRLCVKLYQDECYPLFCNSTKTWKMTCPCRGDLCNGPNTEREEEAFAILSKLVTKTRNTRIKKRTQMNTSKLIPTGDEKTLIITNISALDNNALNNLDYNMTNKDEITDIMLSDESLTINQEMKSENLSLETTVTSVETEEQATKSTIEDVEVKNDSINNTSSETKAEVTMGLDISSPIVTKTAKTMNIVKPSEKLPAAEALQQNTTPKTASEKTTLPITSSFESTYETPIDNNEEITTEKSDVKRNGENKLFATFDVILLNIITLQLYYYVASYMH